jgi:preprotein translocase subunit YajC
MLVTPAFAQTAGAATQGGALASFVSIAPLILIFVAFYFLMIRPQQKRAKMLQEMITSAKKGDTVLTAGGIAGKVTKVEDKFLEVEIAPNVRVRVVKATIAEVTSAGGAKPAND